MAATTAKPRQVRKEAAATDVAGCPARKQRDKVDFVALLAFSRQTRVSCYKGTPYSEGVLMKNAQRRHDIFDAVWANRTAGRQKIIAFINAVFRILRTGAPRVICLLNMGNGEQHAGVSSPAR